MFPSHDRDAGTILLDLRAIKSRLSEERVAGQTYSDQLSDEIFNAITDEQIQFSFVANQAKRMFSDQWNSDSISAEEAGTQFCLKFENPRNASTKCPARGTTAEQLKRDATPETT